jgi:hypothetical protein
MQYYCNATTYYTVASETSTARTLTLPDYPSPSFPRAHCLVHGISLNRGLRSVPMPYGHCSIASTVRVSSREACPPELTILSHLLYFSGMPCTFLPSSPSCLIPFTSVACLVLSSRAHHPVSSPLLQWHALYFPPELTILSHPLYSVACLVLSSLAL